jgi:uncharacterized protein YjbI with pentapeptide repeats
VTEPPIVIQDQEFNATQKLPRFWYRQYMQYCTIDGIEIYEGLDGVYLGLTFKNVLFYWTLWNCTNTIECLFEDCTFQGASFAKSHFTSSTFSNCRFILDNVGGQCSFDDTIFTECGFNACEFVPKSKHSKTMFENTRFYGCKQENCQGLSF